MVHQLVFLVHHTAVVLLPSFCSLNAVVRDVGTVLEHQGVQYVRAHGLLGLGAF